MGLSRFILIACVFSATAAAQPQSEPDPSAGNALVTIGKVMAYGGLGLAVVGYYPTLRLAGLLGFGLGVPLTGLGAGLVNSSAQALDSGYHANSRGWGWNVAGTALAGLGVSSITSGFHEKDPGGIFGGALLFLVGLVCDGVALGKFSNYAEEGRAVMAAHARRVSMEPLWLNPQGRAEPGLRITYRL